MMYRHVIDECIKRAQQDLSLLRRYGRHEDAAHIQRRLDSLRRLRKDAPVATIGVIK